jgi:multidrug transporter EmrE-like cation transporter
MKNLTKGYGRGYSIYAVLTHTLFVLFAIQYNPFGKIYLYYLRVEGIIKICCCQTMNPSTALLAKAMPGNIKIGTAYRLWP